MGHSDPHLHAVPPDDGVVTLTHPDRVYWPQVGFTKRDLAEYYDRVAPLMLPYVTGRPVTMVRCPGGLADLAAGVRSGAQRMDACFYYKHPAEDFPGPFERISIVESGGPATYLTITKAASLTALAQMGVLEVHVWGSRVPDLEHPDLLVFDLDPDSEVPWARLAEGARLVRQVLRARGLESFVKTTGGKGLHVVAPVTPSGDWDQVHTFCRSVAETVAGQAPDRFTATMSKAKRAGKIYVDYLRNTRGSTSIAPYSTRARDGAPVSYPLRWEELVGPARPRAYNLADLAGGLSALQ
jgi:bifunctional non-homologous end joining protein LigD